MRLAIYGAGGFAREVAPPALAAPDGDVVFVSDVADEVGTTPNGILVLSYPQLVAGHADRRVVIAIADSAARRALAEKCAKDGLAFGDIVAPSHQRGHSVEIGEGSILCGNTILTSNIRIGRHFHGNIASYVAHDCIIGDFVTLAPGASCNGHVVIEDDAFIGTGAILRPGNRDKPLVIGKGARVGMGAIVTRDVPPGVTAFADPARVLGPARPR
ncbi:MAG TPA: acetyltransferase [Stellaceae bacterium]|jgi:sugar O-acyltransferase (sialic acid O-acetyltransferase NeuD family)